MIESQTNPASRGAPSPTIAVWRICFVANAHSEQRAIRRFVDPAVAVAVMETILPERLATLLAESVGVDDLYVVHLPTTKSPAAQAVQRMLMDRPRADEAEGLAPQVMNFEVEAFRFRWKPGRVLIESRQPPDEALLAALSQFTYCEWHLEKLERELRRFEQLAPADAPRAYLPSHSDRAEWPRMIESARDLSVLRLRAARLEPTAYSPPRDLPPVCRRVISRLATRAAMEDRLEAVSARLEACEDLYEAAVDRIVEQQGHRLEKGIIVLLAIETLLLLTELGLSLFRHLP